jgi:hypothetical protein
MPQDLVDDPPAEAAAAAICSHNHVEDKRSSGPVRQDSRKRDKPIVGLVAKADRHIRPMKNGARLIVSAGVCPPFMVVKLHDLVDPIVADRLDNAVSCGHQPLSARPLIRLSDVHSSSGDDRPDSAAQPRGNAGLCDACVHARQIRSSRGSVFYLCELSLVDSAFPKYPRLPVIQCAGYRRIAGGN